LDGGRFPTGVDRIRAITSATKGVRPERVTASDKRVLAKLSYGAIEVRAISIGWVLSS